VIDFTNAEVLAFVRTSIQHWIDNGTESFSARLREDAVMSSPFVLETSATTWVRGRQEISRHLNDARSRYKALAITDIATDAALYYTLLLSDGENHLTILMEPEGPPLLIRRMIICKSVFHAG
jgi:hypothetical protein